MQIRSTLFFVFLSAVLVGISAPLGADTWQSNLKGGGVVRIDPVTRKPTVYYRGGSTQLWDGAH